MTLDDFLLNFRETYKTGKDESGEGLKKLEDTLRREFENYSSDKLDKVWSAVRRHHKATWYPIIGQILECMDKAGVNEFVKNEDNGVFYNRCKTCGCNYSLKARVCPDCNRPLNDEVYKNDVEIIKAYRYQSNHITCHENCPICPTFKGNRNIRGARCQGWGQDDFTRSKFKCDDCPCKWCCEEEAKHDTEHQIGSIFTFILDGSESLHDNNWIDKYKSMGIEKGYIFNYAGKRYKNITGGYAGRSPERDKTNWLCISINKGE